MRKMRSVLVAALLTCGAFTALVYTSCTKDKCSGVTCQNGGTCSGGACTCPSGFAGNMCQYSTVEYQNNTYTPVSITVNGQTTTIPAGGVVDYVGTIDGTANATASTSGTTTSGSQIGALITWTISTTFPENGLTIVPLDVDPSYFYLKVINNPTSPGSFNSITVNYGSPAATTDLVNIPNTGVIYGIGYYASYSNLQIYATGPGVSDLWPGLTPLYVSNATMTITAN